MTIRIKTTKKNIHKTTLFVNPHSLVLKLNITKFLQPLKGLNYRIYNYRITLL